MLLEFLPQIEFKSLAFQLSFDPQLFQNVAGVPITHDVDVLNRACEGDAMDY